MYLKYFNRTLPTRARLQAAIGMFFDPRAGWPGSYGGPKWGEFAWQGLKLYNFITDRDYQKAMESRTLLSTWLTMGWAFNKFVQKAEMDWSAKSGAYPVLKVMPLYLRLLGEQRRRFFVPRWEKLAEPLRVESMTRREPVAVQATVDGGTVYCQIKYDSGPRKKKHPIEVSDLARQIIRSVMMNRVIGGWGCREINAGGGEHDEVCEVA